MHELDNPELFAKVITSLETQLNTSGIHKIGMGNEFYILRADLLSGPAVIKVPKDKMFSNVNDALIDSRALLDQEFALMRYVRAVGVTQIPEPIADIEEAEGFGAIIMTYVPSDDSIPDEYALGALLATIHSIEAPPITLSAQENSEIPELISTRLHRRWRELTRLVNTLPSLPDPSTLMKALEPIRNMKQLLHMDFRCVNFRMQNGKVVALLDWSNALIGHPSLELARVAETGETGAQFLEGYASVLAPPTVSESIETIFRLDTATMLALVFLAEDPDPLRSPKAVARVQDLLHKLITLL